MTDIQQTYHYSELQGEARETAYISYIDVHGDDEVCDMCEGDLVDYIDALGDIWDINGDLAE